MTDFTAENELEEALVRAADDPSYAPDFYHQLIEGVVYFIQQAVASDDGQSVGIASMEIDGRQYLPIFSSVTRLQKAISDEVTYAGVNGREFFRMTAGSPVMLNPASDYGKEILPDEAAAIVDGSILNMAEEQTLLQDSTYIIGDPKIYPTEVVNALTALFKKRKSVARAWVAQIMIIDSNPKPTTLVGVESDTSIAELASEAHLVLQQVSIPNPPVDFVEVQEGSEFSDHFLGQTPFYKRSVLRKLF
ncbi:MAG: hypothetical protein HKN77_01605 [Woeseiaceae bacterium]|nr:hypothetical protein [Woeseiaceae bacterium]